MLPACSVLSSVGQALWPQRLGQQRHSLWRRWWEHVGSAAGRGQWGQGSGFLSWEACTDLSRAGLGHAGLEQQTAEQAQRAGTPLQGAATLACEGQPSRWGGDALPASCPCVLARSPIASTGNNRGPQRPPMQVLL